MTQLCNCNELNWRPQSGGQRPRLTIPGRCAWIVPILAWVVLLVPTMSFSQAQNADPSDIGREYAIKAAYLYNFAKYVEWPVEAFANGSSPFVIGVLGKDPFGVNLDEIANTKKLEGRKIEIKRFASMNEYSPCHILFVPAAADAKLKETAAKKADNSMTLLVGEEAGFAEKGAVVNFFMESNRIRFEINPATAKRDKLKISSKLLSLAKIVEEK
jgi:hypothetical protein